MARWEPDARGRLEKAAMELFREHGYDRTTVEDIARRAGLTERTFFRYFADKREVLFSGSKELEQLIVDGVTSSPADAGPLAAVAAAIEAACTHIEGRRDIEFAREQVFPALVNIAVVSKSYDGGRMERYPTAGSGVIVSPAGHVLTNYHVASDAAEITCRLPTNEAIPATVIASPTGANSNIANGAPVRLSR